MDLDTRVKPRDLLEHAAERGQPPGIDEVAKHVGESADQVRESSWETGSEPPAGTGAGRRNHPHGAAVLRSTHSTSGDGRRGELLRELRLGRLRHSAALNRPAEVVSRCEQSKETLPPHGLGSMGPSLQ